MIDDGLIAYDYTALGLCGGVTNAPLTTTTEVYPDSPKATDELCNLGQVMQASPRRPPHHPPPPPPPPPRPTHPTLPEPAQRATPRT